MHLCAALGPWVSAEVRYISTMVTQRLMEVLTVGWSTTNMHRCAVGVAILSRKFESLDDQD